MSASGRVLIERGLIPCKDCGKRHACWFDKGSRLTSWSARDGHDYRQMDPLEYIKILHGKIEYLRSKR